MNRLRKLARALVDAIRGAGFLPDLGAQEELDRIERRWRRRRLYPLARGGRRGEDRR